MGRELFADQVLLGVGTTVDEPDQASGVVTGTVKATDPEGDPLTYALGDGASHGTATVHPDGTFTYVPTPEARHNAATGGATTDSFTVTVVDGHGGSASTSVTVTGPRLSPRRPVQIRRSPMRDTL